MWRGVFDGCLAWGNFLVLRLSINVWRKLFTCATQHETRFFVGRWDEVKKAWGMVGSLQ